MLAHRRISSSDLCEMFGPKFGLKFSPKFGPKFSPKFGLKFSPQFGPKFSLKFGPKFGLKSDWLFAHHPIPNAKFQPITL